MIAQQMGIELSPFDCVRSDDTEIGFGAGHEAPALDGTVVAIRYGRGGADTFRFTHLAAEGA